MPLAFEKQPREGDKAFAAFKIYLELGAERSTRAVAIKLAKSEQLIRRWSAKYDWTARVQAHGEHLSEVERLAIEGVTREKAVEWQKTQEAVKRLAWKKSDELLAMADEFMERWRDTSRVPGFESVVRAIELAMRLKQFAAGMPSEVKEINASLTATIDVDWEIALRKAYGAASPPVNDAPVVDVEEVEANIEQPKSEVKP